MPFTPFLLKTMQILSLQLEILMLSSLYISRRIDTMKYSELFREYSPEEKESAFSLMQQNLNLLHQHIIPDSYPQFVSSYDFSFELIIQGHFELMRDNFTNYAWPLISKSWLRELVPLLRNKNVLEIMSGNGMLAKGLKEFGIHVIPTELAPENYSDAWVCTEKIDAIEAIKKYGTHVDFVLCSWPPMSNLMDRCLLEMRKVNPTLLLIYIGEFGGCNADESFCNHAKVIDNSYIAGAANKMLSWGGIHDSIFLIK